MAQRQPNHNNIRRHTAKKRKSKYHGWIRGLAILLGVMAVSYTPLDVYKRQEHSRLAVAHGLAF